MGLCLLSDARCFIDMSVAPRCSHGVQWCRSVITDINHPGDPDAWRTPFCYPLELEKIVSCDHG